MELCFFDICELCFSDICELHLCDICELCFFDSYNLLKKKLRCFRKERCLFIRAQG